MKRSFVQMLALVSMAAALSACADGQNDTKACDPETFFGNCIDSSHFRTCVSKHIEFMACEYGNFCGMADNGRPACFAPSTTTGTCQVPNATQCNGYFVQTCANGLWTNAPVPCEAGCSNGACVPVTQAECSYQKPCADPNKTCINSTCVAQTIEPECSNQKPCADPNKTCVNNTCVAQTIEPECSEQKPCADPNKTCVNNTCVAQTIEPECSEQKPCADPNKTCVNNTCVAQTIEPECSEQKPCADPNKTCVNNTCVAKTVEPECSEQKPCADLNKTCIYGECKTMASCQTNADCTEFNTLCSESRCHFAPSVRCTQNDDCGPGFLCDNLTCLANNACSMSHTCPDKQICHNGHCQTTPHDACSKEHPCADASKTCIQGQCITCNCKGTGQTCDLQGNCVSTLHSTAKNISEGDICKYTPDWSFCDGNILFSCSSSVGEEDYHVHARDCGANICTNSPTEDLNCHEACTIKGDFYGECLQQYYEITNTFMYYAFKTECTESDDGRLIWTFTEGYETCRAGCTNGSCDSVPVDYGQDCQPGAYADRCIDQWAMTCESQPNIPGKGSIWGEDCAHYSENNTNYTCAISADNKVSGCVLPCAQEGQKTTVCHKYPTYLAVYSESLQCARTTDGSLAYFMTDYQECAKGCNESTGRCN